MRCSAVLHQDGPLRQRRKRLLASLSPLSSAAPHLQIEGDTQVREPAGLQRRHGAAGSVAEGRQRHALQPAGGQRPQARAQVAAAVGRVGLQPHRVQWSRADGGGIALSTGDVYENIVFGISRP